MPTLVPPIDHLGTIGCLCYAAKRGPSKEANKFGHRGQKCNFLGYHPNKKGYQLMNLNSHHIVTSRDVQFHEYIFPFKSLTLPTESYSPYFPSIYFPQSESPIFTPGQSAVDSIIPDPSPQGTIHISPLRKSHRQRHPPAW